MPVSREAHENKKLKKGRAVRISASHARKLRQMAQGRPPTAPLLVMANGEAWNHKDGVLVRGKADQSEPFAIIAAKIGHPEYTATCLRHWSIIRQTMRGDSLQEIAERHDTSIQMISDTYAREIAKRSKEAAKRAREAVFDLSTGAKLIQLAKAAPGGNRARGARMMPVLVQVTPTRGSRCSPSSR